MSDDDAEFAPEDLQIDVFRSVVPEGEPPQSAVRVTHKPTGTTVFVDDFASQRENRDEAIRRLRRRLSS